MAMVFMEQVGPEGERLALAAGEAVEEVVVGWDEELSTATFDSDAYDPDVVLSEDEVREKVFAALDALETDWRRHLRETD